MKIGIDGSRAFINKRTGIEEYSYQVIKNIIPWLKSDEVFLYIRHNQEVDLELPENWKIKKLRFPRFWTQIRLSLEMILNPVDTLFIPAHTVPIVHPKKTIVVVHGLEYEFYPDAYPLADRLYMRAVIKNSCKWASGVVCVSENTKKDLVKLYGIDDNKITVVYEGYNENANAFEKNSYSGIKNKKAKNIFRNGIKYIFFVGRIEKRKNISNIIKAFDFLKDKYRVSHKLVLAGKPGYGYEEIQKNIARSVFGEDIVELGYISDHEKWALLKKSDMLIFPSFYEGFGLPILEAQNALIPVITSNTSSIPEVAGEAALYSDPQDYITMAENIHVLIKNESAKNDLVKRGYENVKRFSWVICAKKIANILHE